MFSMLPNNLKDLRVLYIGVGSGEELKAIYKRKPKSVTAIDVSKKLLEIAKQKYPQIQTVQMNMNNLTFDSESFDFVYSSLALHYSDDWDNLLIGINRVLKPRDTLLFSTHNPEYWSQKPATGKSYTNKRGVTLTEHQDVLPGYVEITFYNHKNKNNIDDALKYAGFIIKDSIMPKMEKPKMKLSIEDAKNYNKLKAKNEKLPLFYVVKAQKYNDI